MRSSPVNPRSMCLSEETIDHTEERERIQRKLETASDGADRQRKGSKIVGQVRENMLKIEKVDAV